MVAMATTANGAIDRLHWTLRVRGSTCTENRTDSLLYSRLCACMCALERELLTTQRRRHEHQQQQRECVLGLVWCVSPTFVHALQRPCVSPSRTRRQRLSHGTLRLFRDWSVLRTDSLILRVPSVWSLAHFLRLSFLSVMSHATPKHSYSVRAPPLLHARGCLWSDWYALWSGWLCLKRTDHPVQCVALTARHDLRLTQLPTLAAQSSPIPYFRHGSQRLMWPHTDAGFPFFLSPALV